jgi:hypothetical protein
MHLRLEALNVPLELLSESEPAGRALADVDSMTRARKSSSWKLELAVQDKRSPVDGGSRVSPN